MYESGKTKTNRTGGGQDPAAWNGGPGGKYTSVNQGNGIAVPWNGIATVVTHIHTYILVNSRGIL